MYKCNRCGEVFHYKDEVVFLNGDNVVLDEEDGGSGDIDEVICLTCYDG